MFGGKSMGGGTAGNIIRTASRAVARAGTAGPSVSNRPSSPTSSSRTTHRHGASTNFHGLSSSSSIGHCPVSATCGCGWHFCNRYCDEFEWISEDGIESENVTRVSEDSIGWSAPSLDEVHGAVSAIHRVFGQDRDEAGRVGEYTVFENRVGSGGSEVDWVEPCLELQLGPGGRGVERVYDAFHLLQTDPSVQRMVMSVSSDRAVWDAIMNNEEVQRLRNSFYQAKDNASQNSEESSSDEPSDESTNIVQWIFKNTKTRVMEVIERITELMNHLFQNGNDDGDNTKTRAEGRDLLEEKLRSSFLISIVVLLVVMVTRAHKASQ